MNMITSVNTFAGIGGWNVAEKYLGIRTLLAANHSAPSLKTNKLNFPHTKQCNLDIMTCDEDEIVDADIMTASPECTNHTNANGKKRKKGESAPSLLEYMGWTDRSEDTFAELSRETMRGVHRWAEVKVNQGKPFKMIFVENVTDIRKWEGLDSWYKSMEKLGYEHTSISFNSRFARPFPKSTPQNRDRAYIVFWLADLPAPDMDIQPLSYCKRCEAEVNGVQCWISNKPFGDYGVQYVYRCPLCNREIVPYFTPAQDVLDFSLPTPKIGERIKKPLCEETIKKIEKGLRWYMRQDHTNDKLKAFQFTYNKNPVFRLLSDVSGTCTKKHRHALITLPEDWNGGPVSVVDCGYRMFVVDEYKNIMGLPDWFRFECSQAETIKQIGLAVTPAAAVEILSRGIVSLGYVEDPDLEVVSA
jgi:DNA (cytosine-5)-methyltransferase 1